MNMLIYWLWLKPKAYLTSHALFLEPTSILVVFLRKQWHEELSWQGSNWRPFSYMPSAVTSQLSAPQSVYSDAGINNIV